MLKHSRLLEVLHYDPLSGVFTWRVSRNQVEVGAVAGHKNTEDKDFIRITVDGRFYLAHRLAWFYMKKRWPRKQIDHRDGDQSNNRFDNLRQATGQQNGFNRKVDARNKSGATGAVSYTHLTLPTSDLV